MSEPLHNVLDIIFTSPLRVEYNGDGTWTLLEEFRYLSRLTGKAYSVPKGEVTDFASVPRWPIAYWLTGGRAIREAVIHDRLYKQGDIESKETADKIFLEAMQRLGVEPQWAAALMYSGVVIGGWGNFPREEHSVEDSPFPVGGD